MNVSVDNVNSVIENVTSIVSSANETSDQNRDNLEVVADVLTRSVIAIQTQYVLLEVVSQVSMIACTEIGISLSNRLHLMLWKFWTMLKSGQWKLYKNRVTR